MGCGCKKVSSDGNVRSTVVTNSDNYRTLAAECGDSYVEQCGVVTPNDPLKFTTYKGIAYSYDEAVTLIEEKCTTHGAQCVVRYYSDFESQGENSPVELAFGIGNQDGSRPFIVSSELQKFIGNEKIVIDDREYTIHDAIEKILESLMTEKEIRDFVAESIEARRVPSPYKTSDGTLVCSDLQAEIMYTKDGVNWKNYSGEIFEPEEEEYTLRCYAVKDDFLKSKTVEIYIPKRY